MESFFKVRRGPAEPQASSTLIAVVPVRAGPERAGLRGVNQCQARRRPSAGI